MKRLFLLLLVLAAYSTNSFASADYTAYWQKANKFYEQKEYDSAAYYYEQITQSKPEDAAVYYNLGNTYYRLNLIGPAVLNYERALRLEPSHKDAQDNLYLAQGRINNRIQSVPEIFFLRWWHTITHANKATPWAYISLILFLAAIGLSLAKRFNKLETPPQLTIGLFITWGLSLILAFTSASNKADSKKAVVMSQDAIFLLSLDNTKTQSLIPEGTVVKWKSSAGEWVSVALPDGRSGWMQKNTLTKI